MKLSQCLNWLFKSSRNFAPDHEAFLFVFALSQQHQLHGTFSWVALISLSLADLRGAPGTRAPGVQIFSFSCSFRQKICIIIPSWELANPLGKILDPPLPMYVLFSSRTDLCCKDDGSMSREINEKTHHRVNYNTYILFFLAKPPEPPPTLVANETRNATEAPPEVEPEEGLSRELIIVISICSIVVVVGIGVVVIYVVSIQHKHMRYISHFSNHVDLKRQMKQHTLR